VTHRIRTVFAPITPHEDLIREQLTALSHTKKLHDQEIKKLRANLAFKLKKTRNALRLRAKIILQNNIQEIQIENLKSMELKYKQVSAQAEQDCFELALSLAKKIIGESINTGQSNLKERIRSVLPRLSLSRKIRILANPSELPTLYELCNSKAPQTAIDLEADSKISPGNARIESSSGAVEVSWEAHFDSLVDLLKRHQLPQRGVFDA
jgi:flagellar biosynthesis/type III secretory pathway protein FliH